MKVMDLKGIRRRQSYRCVLAFILAILTFQSGTFAQDPVNPAAPAVVPQLSTDKLDYQPGETARIRGLFFPPNEPVTVQVVHADGTAEPGPAHQPWTVVSNSEGHFETTWYVEPETSVDKLFTVSATTDGGLRVEVQFTDAIITTTYVLNLVDSGWYTQFGEHTPNNKNYFVGVLNSTRYRDYFIFNLAGVSGTVTSASLRAQNPAGSGASRFYSLFDVTTPASTVMSSTSSAAVFNDLGSGTLLGQALVDPFSNPVQVSLNSNGLAKIQASLGTLIGFGGDYGGGNNEWIFGFSGGGPGSSAVQLTLQVQRVIADTALAVDAATGTFGGTTTLKATLTSDALGVGNKTVTFSRFGTPVGTAVTNAVGVAELNGVSLAGVNAGTYANAIAANFAGDSSYGGSSGSNTLIVNPATPTVTWPAPAPIAYGTALSATQLNATSSVAGTFVYTPSAGSVLNAGTGQTLSTTFTPSSPNYTSVTTTVLIDVLRGTPVISWSNPTPITYGTLLSGTQLNATANVAGSFAYTPAAGALLTAGSHTLTTTFTPADTNNYNDKSASVSLTVLKATPVLSTSGGTFTYDGSPHPSVGTSDVPGTFTYAYTPGGSSAPANASPTPYQVTATFTPNDTANYNGGTATNTITINKATPVVTWNTPTAIVYGTLLGGTQLNATANVLGGFAYSPAAGALLNAGSHTLMTTFTPTDTNNYNNKSASVSLTVLKATPVLSTSGGTFTYDGSSHASVGSSDVPGTFTYSYTPGGSSAPVNASATPYQVTATFTPDDTLNYNSGTATNTITINKAMPAITWNDPASIVYGTLLGDTQLNATANVSGSFSYSPAAGTQLNAGSHTLMTTFTPTDTTNYHNKSASASLTVLKASPVLSTSGGTFTYNGSAHASVGSSNVPGTFTYSYTPGGSAAPVNASTTPYQVTATFTPADAANYNGGTATNTITIVRATPVVAWSNPADITFGTLLSATQLNASASVVGSFVYSPAAGTLLNAGNGQILSTNFTPADTTNYNAVPLTTVVINVAKAPSAVEVTGGIYVFDGQPHLATGVVRGVGGAVIATPTFAYTPAIPVAPGIYGVAASFAGNANYLPSNNTTSIVINVAPTVLSVTGPTDPLAVNTSATVTATFDDAATLDTHSCKFIWDDGKPDTIVQATSAQTSCATSHSYSAAGVYVVQVVVTDDDDLSGSASYRYVVVYDPNAGFVTGGGWINSPTGAYAADSVLTGKANFGFVSKYKKGMTVPTGDTEFQFQVADLRFKSTIYEWLVVSGARGQYKGTGTINDIGDYGFLLSAVDGQVSGGGNVDRFRIKIWDRATNVVVYDNLLGASDDLTVDPQTIGGGSIVIHTK